MIKMQSLSLIVLSFWFILMQVLLLVRNGWKGPPGPRPWPSPYRSLLWSWLPHRLGRHSACRAWPCLKTWLVVIHPILIYIIYIGNPCNGYMNPQWIDDHPCIAKIIQLLIMAWIQREGGMKTTTRKCFFWHMRLEHTTWCKTQHDTTSPAKLLRFQTRTGGLRIQKQSAYALCRLPLTHLPMDRLESVPFSRPWPILPSFH